MARKFTERDLELLGYQSPHEVQDTSGWLHLTANLNAGLESISTDFYYIKTKCLEAQCEEAAKTADGEKKTYVLWPEGCDLRFESVAAKFSKKAEVLKIDDILWKRLSSLFSNYLIEMERQVPSERFFVQPRRVGVAEGKLDQELANSMQSSQSASRGSVTVVSASAGVGKTTLAREVTRLLLRRVKDSRAIPIYIEASHWDRYNLQADLELWDIIRNSLDQFGAVGLVSKELFFHGLKQGYFVFIFDGFDELCSPRNSQFSPLDVLRSLSEIALASEARMMLTTRSLFWKNEIPEGEIPSNIQMVELDSFNKQQALGYFNERFKSSITKRNLAVSLYEKLVTDSEKPKNDSGGSRAKFANLPFVVVMLGEYADRGGVSFESAGDLIEDMLRRLCGRDQARQDLSINASNQLAAFSEIAVDWYDQPNPEFDVETLGAAGFPIEDLGDVKHHALLAAGKTGSTFKFKWDFIAPYLRALVVAKSLVSADPSSINRCLGIMRLEANGKGFTFEHVIAILESSNLSAVSSAYRRAPANEKDFKSFLCQVILGLISKDKNAFTNLAERSQAFFNAIGATTENSKRVISNLYLVGQLERLDLRNVRFENCEFRDCTISHCDVDNHTEFRKTVFAGSLEISPSSRWKEVVVHEDCDVRSPASLTLSSVSALGSHDADDLLLDAFRLGLVKFWHNGHPKDNIKKDDWKRGLLGRTKYCTPVLDALEKAGAIEESTKGRFSDTRLLLNRDCFAELQHFMDNRQLSGKLAAAFDMFRKWNS